MFKLYDTVYLSKNLVDHLHTKHDKGSLACVVECLKDGTFMIEVFDPWGTIVVTKNQIARHAKVAEPA